MQAIKRIFRYLQGTKNLGLEITPMSNKLSTITTFCDSDWAGESGRVSI